MKAGKHLILTRRITRISRICFRRVGAIVRNRLGGSGEPPLPKLRDEAGFALVVALVMVALMAVIAVGVLTTVSVERVTATSYSSRYPADLSIQNVLHSAALSLASST